MFLVVLYFIFFLDLLAVIILQALAMVEEETRRYRPTKNYLGHLPPLDLTAYEVSITYNYGFILANWYNTLNLPIH